MLEITEEQKEFIKQSTREYSKEYYQKYEKEKWHKRYKDNRDKIKKQNKIYRDNHKEDCKKYHDEHRDERRLRENNKWRTDLKYKLNKAIRNQIYISIKTDKLGKHWEDLVGYNVGRLKNHLQNTLPLGYVWQDYSDGKLHIDHIIPISVFNFTKSRHIDFKRCWALSNLRLLPAKENLSKSNKLYKPFQPTLKLNIY